MTTRAAEIVKQGLRELAQEEGASVGQVLSYAGASVGGDLITGGGASFPDEWTVGADGSLLIDLAVDVKALHLRGAVGQTEPLIYLDDSDENELVYLSQGAMRLRTTDAAADTIFSAQSSDGTSAFEATGDGSGGVDTILMEAATSIDLAAGDVYLGADVSGAAGTVFLHANILRGMGSTFQVMARTTAPPDENIPNGGWTLWLDPTNGAAKLMVKAKETGGTVRTAAINLA